MLSGWIIAVAGASDLRVGPGQPFATPQDALDAAADGDRILVDAGSYGPLDVDVDVEIVGLGEVVIAGADGQAMNVTADVVLRGLVLDGLGSARALRVHEGARLLVEDGALRNGRSPFSEERDAWGGCARIDGARVGLRRTTVSDCRAESGAGIYAVGSALELDAVTLRGNTAGSGVGGGLAIESSTLSARGCRFEGNLADDLVGEPHIHGLGGGIFSGDATVTLRGCTFTGNEARSFGPDSGRGGALRLWLTDAVVEGCTFERDTASAYGSAIAAASSTLVLSGSAVRDNVVDASSNQPAWGGAVFCDEASDCAIDRAWFEGNTAGDGGAVCTLGDLTVTTSMFCGNTATSDAGAVDLGNAYPDASVTLAGNVFAENTAGLTGGALVVTGGAHAVTNNHLVGNRAHTGGAVSTALPDGGLGLVLASNLVAGNTSDEGPVIVLDETAFLEDFSWFWDNAPVSTTFEWGPGSAEGDPGLAGPLGSCDPRDLQLGSDSPLRDAGPNDDASSDTDGSPNDLGAFGGPSGDLSAFLDTDGDGVPAMLDCDDGNPDVHPTMPELCSNGIDDDCDTLTDDDDIATDAARLFLDADGDGIGGLGDMRFRCPASGWAPTADDCDDADPDVTAEETWYVDADGDGLGDPSSGEPGCTAPPNRVAVGGDCDDTDPAHGSSCRPSSDVPSGGDGVGQPPEPAYGFGCATGPGGSGAGLVGLLLLARRRDRSSP